MAFIIFVIVLGVLVFVHELGHFLAAKSAGVRVDEFGFGYPPKALEIGEKWGTLFTLNWIPFGGFVKIYGENYEENEKDHLSSKVEKSTDKILLNFSSYSVQSTSQGIFQSFDSENLELNVSELGVKKNLNFTQVSKKWQAVILASGVIFNIIFAWLIFSLSFMIGVPTPVDNSFGAVVKNPILTIVEVVPDSPAQKAGMKTGDKIESISLEDGNTLGPASLSGADLNPDNVSNFVDNSSGEILVEVDRGDKILDFKLTPEAGIEKDRKIVGIGMDMVGTLTLPIYKAFYEGGKTTLQITYLTVAGVVNLVKGAAVGKADISEISGPVGIVGLVGDASRLGFAYLLTFTALISINLAIINLIPFPALDGGRILFVAIEGVTKKKINPKFAQTVNTVGFVILIALMLIVTYRDILKLF